MPHYHVHLRTPEGLQRDEDGLAFADLDAAYLEICRTIPDLAADLLRAGRDPMVYAFIIADAEDRRLMEVPFRERVRDGRGPKLTAGRSPVDTCCVIERARSLVDDVRLQHVQLRDNLDILRALMTEHLGPDVAQPGRWR